MGAQLCVVQCADVDGGDRCNAAGCAGFACDTHGKVTGNRADVDQLNFRDLRHVQTGDAIIRQVQHVIINVAAVVEVQDVVDLTAHIY